MTNIDRRLVVVLGMHRSGTSAITHALGLLGVELGDNLHPAGFDNPKGFWEDRSIIEINERLLQLKNSEYSRLGFAWKNFESDETVAELTQTAIRLLASKLDMHGGTWGFKDPRTCRLLSFWMNVFKELGCRVCFVIAIRNPMSVAASLTARNDIPAEKAYFLWLQHTLPALLDTAGAQRVVVDYDKLLDAPHEQLERISTALDLPLPPRDTAQVIEFEREFLADELRHTRFSLAELLADHRALPGVHDLYRLLLQIASDEEQLTSLAAISALEELNSEISALSPLVDYINSLELLSNSLMRAELEMRTRFDATIDSQIKKIDGQAKTIASQKEQALELEEKVGQLHGAMSAREQELQETIAEQACQHTALQEQNTELQQVITRHNAEFARIFASRPWRLVHHIQLVYAGMLRIKTAPRRYAGTIARRLWQQAPLPLSTKYRIKNSVFSRLSFVLRKTAAHQNWKRFNEPFSPVADGSAPANLPQNSASGEVTFVPLLKAKPLAAKPAKLICFYLPQFHAMPENDAWWGEGFTEWTNVRPAQPQFVGHYQPRRPWELDYYNLLDPATQQRQVELAHLYGIEGFCFYFYWFGGKRLLEAPTENYLHNSALDLPFCLCWANENWSRRWDGLDSEILIAQQHSPADDLAFIEHIARYMRDARYIRIDGKPLLLVYRPSLLPDAKQTATRWRDWCRANGIGEIYLAYTQSFELANPEEYGFDAAIEFPPNNSAPPNITDSVAPLTQEFGTTVYDWRVFVERSKNYRPPGYKLFRSVCPAWDNTARRKNCGTVFLNSTPELYQQWLGNAIEYTRQQFPCADEQLIFVNAWNEWAEGAYLEPDAKYGYAYLQATRNALTGTTAGVVEAHKTIVLVTHDAHPHGAQYLALNLAKTLTQQMGFHVDMVCLGDGPLKAEYAKWATLHDLAGVDPEGAQAQLLARQLYQSGNRSALVNTTVSGHFLKTLTENGFECVALIHELRGVLEQFGLHSQARTIAEYATKVIFPAGEVATSFEEVAPLDPAKIVIRPQGIYKRKDRTIDRQSVRKKLRHMLGLPEDSMIVLGVGYADHRKGIDLFVEAGLKMATVLPNARWVWIGHWEQNCKARTDERLATLAAADNPFVFPGLQADTDLFYGGADVFALTSREDPFPSVVLEALDAELPVVGFENAGGFIGLLNEGCGELVAHEDSNAFADAVRVLLESPERRHALGAKGAELIGQRFSFRHYIFDLLDYMNQGLPRVSVVVPSFNYAHYLPQRLSSIIKQQHPIYEIIFCDDCSADTSVNIARDILANQPIDYSIILNEVNSGSVFRQWKKGVDAARGSHVWIAEADDFCSPQFLTEVMRGFDAPDVVLSYCESKQINAVGMVLADSYLDYVADVDAELWKNPFIMSGAEQIRHALCVKNTIPNVSGIVFARKQLTATLEDHIELISEYRIAGDWLTYILILRTGRIAFSPQPLNMHRRHDSGVTIGNFNNNQLNEIKNVQKFVAAGFSITPQQARSSREYIDQLARRFGLSST